MNPIKPFRLGVPKQAARLSRVLKMAGYQIGLAILLVTLISQAQAQRDYDNLADQLADLGNSAGVEIKHLDLAEKFPAKKVDGDLSAKVAKLLSDFNYTIVQSPGQGIERIIIVGRKHQGPRRTILHTERHGKNHVIRATISGMNGSIQEVSLIVDTGADYIVLPKSMMESLGLDQDSTAVNRLQTANGVIDALIGRLAQLRIGNETVADVEVAFVDDKQLGDAKLLGMNVLKRYRFTLDDKRQTITLIRAE